MWGTRKDVPNGVPKVKVWFGWLLILPEWLSRLRGTRYVASRLQQPTEELEMRARTKEIRRARITVIPLKVHLPEKPTIAMVR